MKPIVVAITGASGAIYAVRLLQQLAHADQRVELVISPSGWSVLGQELEGKFRGPMPDAEATVKLLLGYVWPLAQARWGQLPTNEQSAQIRLYQHGDYFCSIASGSAKTQGMIICPCSGATMAGVAHASGDNLIQRAADVHLKERRKLLLVPRETPLSTFQLENMHRVSQAGATILPAMPGWYHGVTDLLDLVDFIVARILDHFEIEHSLIKRWAIDH